MAKHYLRKLNFKRRKWAAMTIAKRLRGHGVLVKIGMPGGNAAIWAEYIKMNPTYASFHWKVGLEQFFFDQGPKGAFTLPYETRPKQQPRPATHQPSKLSPKSAEFIQSNEFLETYQWRELRMRVLRHYGARCMACGATPADGAVMNVDHIKCRRFHPELALEFSNLQVLCHECNHGKGNWDETDWRKPQPPKGTEPPPTLN